MGGAPIPASRCRADSTRSYGPTTSARRPKIPEVLTQLLLELLDLRGERGL